MLTEKYICLDRDGTIIKLVPHLTQLSEVAIISGVMEGCKLLKLANYKFGVFTNQSVIGRGMCTWHEVEKIHDYIKQEFGKNGISLDFFYVCPHKPTENCICRKPEIDMGLKAIQQFRINQKESYMIGDSITDVEFGNKLGMKTVYISEKDYDKATIVCKDFFSAAECIYQKGE